MKFSGSDNEALIRSFALHH